MTSKDGVFLPGTWLIQISSSNYCGPGMGCQAAIDAEVAREPALIFWRIRTMSFSAYLET